MNQDAAAGKILLELLKLEIANEDNEQILYNYLVQAYGAGYDVGRKEHMCKKPVGQYTLDGKLIKIWNSSKTIYMKMGMSKNSISRALTGQNKTCVGYRWKYVNSITPSSTEETIGGLKGLARPRLKTRVSKTTPLSQSPDTEHYV